MNKENPYQIELKCTIYEIVQELLKTKKHLQERSALEYLWNRARQLRQPLPFKSQTFDRFYGSYRKFKHSYLKTRNEAIQ